MSNLFLVTVFAAIAVIAPKFIPTTKIRWLKDAVRIGAGVIALFICFATS
jgi:hypothetical protein